VTLAPTIITPDLHQPLIPASRYAPSWSGSLADSPFLNPEHRSIFEITRMLPGWQDPADSQKLYEAAYHNGSVILEIGVYGGRSAVVQLRGALAGARDQKLLPPQFFGLDISAAAIARGVDSLRDSGLLEHALLFHGDLSRFLSEIPITPTMVFVDGDHTYTGCRADLGILASRLLRGTPVLCHDYGGIQGVRQAVDELVRDGAFEKMGCFASSVLLRAAARSVSDRPACPKGLAPPVFSALRDALLECYASRDVGDGGSAPDTDHLTESARFDAFGIAGGWRPEDDSEYPKSDPIQYQVKEPDLVVGDRPGFVYAPSWSAAQETAGASGQDVSPAPTHSGKKLFEAAFQCGSVIMGIGLRHLWPASLAILGARKGEAEPQFFGTDTDAGAVRRAAATLAAEGVQDRAVLYHGTASQLLSELPITPSLIVFDSEPTYAALWELLRSVADRLPPGTPILCVDCAGVADSEQAVDEAVRTGRIERMGRFGVSLLLRASLDLGRRPSLARGLSPETLDRVRESLFRCYAGWGLKTGATSSPVPHLTSSARAQLLATPPAPRTTIEWPRPRVVPLLQASTRSPRFTVVSRLGRSLEQSESTLLSVAHQGYPETEHIVIVPDQKSLVGTLVRDFPGITLVLDERELGRAGAVRRAVAFTSGVRILCLEQGELLPPGSLHMLAELGPPAGKTEITRVPVESVLSRGSSWLSSRIHHPGDAPAWADPADAREVYDLVGRSGPIILSVGLLGGRSGLTELRGALAACRDAGLPSPQFFGIDPDRGSVARCRDAMERAGLSRHALLYHGPLEDFVRELPIDPTIVLLEGYPGQAKCATLLRQLRSILAPGTPVLACRYSRAKGVRAATDDAIARGSARRIGPFARGMLLSMGAATAPRSSFSGRGLSPRLFEETRISLLGRLIEPDDPTTRSLATSAARSELTGSRDPQVTSGRAAWPCSRADDKPLPATMPGGEPWPRISIVTPSFNQGKYIEETLLSVRNQGYPNLEHIVMDGGSSDDTLEIVNRYRDGLAHVVSRKDKGQSDAINRGFKLATGEILTWLNSDDMLAPGALAAVAFAFGQSGADMVAGECHIYRGGEFEARHLTACENGPLPLEDLLDVDGAWLEGQFFYQPEVMFTRKVWDRAGGHVSEALYHSMDYELWLRMAEAGAKLHVIGRPVALFRAHAEQKTAGEVVGGFRAELPKARDTFLARTGRSWVPPSRTPRKDRLRVVLFNDLGFAYGAGIAHRRLAEALLAAGHEVFPLAASLTDYHTGAPKLSHRDTVERIASFEPDLVVVGNMHGADVEPALLGAISTRCRTAFVLHDMWLLTGRCAYTGTCRRYLDRCDGGCSCPQVHPLMHGDLIGPAWDTKRRILGGSSDLALWANSDWMRLKAEEALSGAGALAGPPPQTIKFGFELDTFRPRDKSVCRELLGLPRDKFIIMSSASSLADPRKGLSHLAEAMAELRLDDSLVMAVGWFNAGEKPPIPGMRAMGYTKDPQRLAMIYSAADLFVGPSLEEAFGQVYIEAAACGTPSIGYPVGGKPEAICDGVSGRLALANEPTALAQSIFELYQDRELRENMSRWGRIWAENEWSMTSSFHRIFNVMHRQGFGDCLGRRLNLSVKHGPLPEAIALGPALPSWRAISGFDLWEGPYPERGIGRCRWALGPSAVFEMDARHSRRATILISCRCFEHHQRIRLMHGTTAVGERDLAADAASKTDRVVTFEVDMNAGVNRFTIEFWKWGRGGRPMAILVTGITAIPNGPDVQPVVIEPKPLSGVSVKS
jgi:glycosyltransferase involved in cell wall biosynthesis